MYALLFFFHFLTLVSFFFGCRAHIYSQFNNKSLLKTKRKFAKTKETVCAVLFISFILTSFISNGDFSLCFGLFECFLNVCWTIFHIKTLLISTYFSFFLYSISFCIIFVRIFYCHFTSEAFVTQHFRMTDIQPQSLGSASNCLMFLDCVTHTHAYAYLQFCKLV